MSFLRNNIIKPFDDTFEIDKGTVVALAVIILTLFFGAILVIDRRKIQLPFLPKKSSVDEVELKSPEKNFVLDYSSFPTNYIVRLANFEPDEEWLQDVKFSDTINWEGKNSLLLESKDGILKESYLFKKIDLANIQFYKIAVYLLSDPSDLSSAAIYFSNKNKTASYSYPLTNLSQGWNFLRIQKLKFSPNFSEEKSGSASAKFGWDKIERIGVSASARSNSSATIYFDDLSGFQGEDYLNDWLTVNPVFLDLTKIGNETALRASNFSGNVAILKKLSGISDFVFKAKAISLREGARSGLLVRGDYKKNTGYYFLIDGNGGNRWEVSRIGSDEDPSFGTIILKNGIINNFKMEANKPIWMKVEGRGQLFKFYLSLNGKDYTLVTEVKDGGIAQGGLGIAVFDHGVSAFSNFEFQK